MIIEIKFSMSQDPPLGRSKWMPTMLINIKILSQNMNDSNIKFKLKCKYYEEPQLKEMKKKNNQMIS